MILDPHIHSIYSGDAKGTPRQIIKRAILVGLDAIAITDHDTMQGSKVAKKEVKDFKSIIIVPGMEISTSKGHILALGVQEEIKKGVTPQEAVDRIHEQGAIAIVPHPFVRYRKGLFVNIQDLKVDAIETLNSRYILGYSNWKAKKFAKKRNLPMIGASDAHFVTAIGSCYTQVDSEPNPDDILSAIKKGKTKPHGSRTPLHLILKEVINKKIKKC
ncbi:MAG TPA: PHP domain-containing protein [Methanothermobacter sp.]|jgi:predicted metal-dependent phosphoesterase TrpH|uniref:Histidinol-phosphatase n=1 Tax=Methanothermobacter tenebrarum TaxID=680118 RepID=A0ABN6PBT6_9EURY|nr:PHP domain-containing protein [Methanothermobacter tenebrarum]MDD3454264.1 PHP domain-containing protein [Methanobacteriales archaeon]MDX9693848.1 PHP domain-containing protein [Methanothermobacter sp.]BDH78670.1 histidinol-phosphatase [Methanothermobacter tenebrarum]HHW16346.1 PHP domain-containing protein [Methanothermobacter sp.]